VPFGAVAVCCLHPKKEKKMILYGVPLSVHTRKVIIAARAKQLDYELRIASPLMPDSLPPDWLQICPTGLIPAMDDDGFRLADSTAIIHYLEQKHPSPPLLPTDAAALGTTLFLDAWAGGFFRSVVHPVFHNQVVNPMIRKLPPDQAAIDAALGQATLAFAYLESLSPHHNLVGQALTLADLSVVSNLVLFHYLGHRIDARFPKLDAYFQRQVAAPLMGSVLADEVPFVDQMGLDRRVIG
jgi:glutathione S-transferase